MDALTRLERLNFPMSLRYPSSSIIRFIQCRRLRNTQIYFNMTFPAQDIKVQDINFRGSGSPDKSPGTEVKNELQTELSVKPSTCPHRSSQFERRRL